MSELQIVHGESPAFIEQAQALRRQVFIEGQGVPESRELDGLDDRARHYIGFTEGEPVAVARTRDIYLGSERLGNHDLKIERVGVLEAHRGHGYGRQVMACILDRLAGQPLVRNALLESQLHAMDFYVQLGFVPTGPEFQDAGIPHKKMYKPIHAIEGFPEENTFVIMAALGAVTVSRALLEQSDLERLPSDLFAAQPPLSGDLVSGKLATKPLRTVNGPRARACRDVAVNQILELADPASGVAAGTNLAGQIMQRSTLVGSDWNTATKVLIAESAIRTVKPALKSRIAAIVIHPGRVENMVRSGQLSVPSPAQIGKLAEIDRASPLSSVQAVARALEPSSIA